jgi:hypothetical protein
VDTGQVMWVYKHLPLPMHPSAPNAAVAAECAGDQGQFGFVAALSAVRRTSSGQSSFDFAAISVLAIRVARPALERLPHPILGLIWTAPPTS